MSDTSKREPSIQPPTTPPKLKISRSDAYEKLNTHVAKGFVLLTHPNKDKDIIFAFSDSETWREYATRLLAFCFDNTTVADEFEEKTRRMFMFHNDTSHETKVSSLNELMLSRVRALESILQSLDLYEENISLPVPQLVSSVQSTQELASEKIKLIVNRFHIAARQLRHRHAGRETLTIADEYDTQDFFHVLLQLFFDDIRNEEWTPSYAGGASRIDFLLKPEQILVEIKMTRAGLTRERDVSDQLIVDSDRYQSHPDCKMLVAFVYDPQEFLNNPAGIERDLTKTINGVPVKVFVRQR